MIEAFELNKKYRVEIGAFEKAKYDYYAIRTELIPTDLNSEPRRITRENLCKAFVDILKLCGNESTLSESGSLVYQTEGIPSASLTTDKSDINITLGLFRMFYIATKIKNPHNIKYMKDDFWALMFELSLLGEFNFKEENEVLIKDAKRKYPKLFNKQGNYYKLLRNYFLLEVDYEKVDELGIISVSWDHDMEIDLLIPKLYRVFEIMYKINFLLWRKDNKVVRF